MLYDFLYPMHEQFSFLNVFRYITFRTAVGIMTALILAFALGKPLIRYLQYRNWGERIREDAPDHHNAKAGTPTMGGILILISIIIPVLMWNDLSNRLVLAGLLAVVLFGIVGMYDDMTKMKKGDGLPAKKHFLLQVLAAAPVLWVISTAPGLESTLTIVQVPFFKNIHPDLGGLYYVFAMLVIVGASNAVNLTDGLDGLAIGPVIIAFLTYSFIAYVTGHSVFAEYLQITFVKGVGEFAIFCGIVVGASIGFLWYNTYPAQVFMGNTGSVSLGALLGVTAIITKHELLLLLIGGLFVVEALSVIIQVGYYKMTKRRVFLMAPLHHHFEKKGWAEPKVIIRFWIVAILLAMMSLATLKLR